MQARGSFSAFRLATMVGLVFLVVAIIAHGAAPPIQKRLTLEERQAIANRANNLRPRSVELFNQKKYAEAGKLNLHILDLYDQILPAKDFPTGHPAIAAGLGFQAAMLKMQHKEKEAVPYAERCLAMYDKLFPPRDYPKGHPATDRALDFLGMVVYDLAAAALKRHDLREAISFGQRAVEVYERRYPPARYRRGDLQVSQAYNNLGGAYLYAGEHHRAVPCFRRSLAIREGLSNQGNAELARGFNNLGSLLREQGEFEESRVYLEKSRVLFKKLHPKGHPDWAMNLTNLGILYHAQRDKRAIALLEQALTMYRQSYPEGHRDLASCLQTLASMLDDPRDNARAITLLEEALKMSERLSPVKDYPRGSPDVVGIVHNLGTVYHQGGQLAKSKEYLRRCLTMTEQMYPTKVYPDGHPQLALVCHSLGLVYRAEGKLVLARGYFERSLVLYQNWADANFASVSEAEALSMANRMQNVRDAFLSITRPDSKKGTAAGGDIYPHIWRNKAAITQAVERRQQLLGRVTDPKAKQLWQDLIQARWRLSQLAQAIPLPAEGETRRAEMQKLTADKEDLERRITQMPGLAGAFSQARSPHTALLKALPEGTVFVDILRYDRRDSAGKRGEEGIERTANYVAFVLRPGKPVARVELGAADSMETAVRGWRTELKSGTSGVHAATLSQRIWQVLEPSFGTARVVVISPDGALSAIPWSALPERKKGKILLEEYAVAVVPHGPFLLQRLLADAPGKKEGLVLAAGGVSYDETPAPLTHSPPTQYRAAKPTVKQWPALDGTGREVVAVKELAKGHSVLALSKTDASAARVLAELPRARFVHLATHGYFADPKAEPSVVGVGTFGQRGSAVRNRLLQSGLVWAGANKSPSAHEVRILTAEAIASLPLQHLELAVLSACETGLGEVTSGEGVFGLQRAFHQAGAQHVIGSLWKVEDQATVALMLLFYQMLWKENLPPLAALRAAQLELYRHPKKIKDLTKGRGLDFFDLPPGDTAQPRLWAAFVLSGVSREELIRTAKELAAEKEK